MASNLATRVRSLGSSVFRLAAALTVTAVAIGAIAFGTHWAYTYSDREQAKRAEIMRTWSNDLSSHLGMKLQTKTKVTDGTMHIALAFDAYPEFLKLPTNKDNGFFLEWKDADGFTLVKKFVQVSEFSRVVNEKGEPYGLKGQFSEPVSVASYSKLTSMTVGWNIETDRPQQAAAVPRPASANPATADHCAPGLNRQERLRRLAQHGQVRQTGMGEYTAGGRVVQYLGDSNELYACR